MTSSAGSSSTSRSASVTDETRSGPRSRSSRSAILARVNRRRSTDTTNAAGTVISRYASTV